MSIKQKLHHTAMWVWYDARSQVQLCPKTIEPAFKKIRTNLMDHHWSSSWQLPYIFLHKSTIFLTNPARNKGKNPRTNEHHAHPVAKELNLLSRRFYLANVRQKWNCEKCFDRCHPSSHSNTKCATKYVLVHAQPNAVWQPSVQILNWFQQNMHPSRNKEKFIVPITTHTHVNNLTLLNSIHPQLNIKFPTYSNR